MSSTDPRLVRLHVALTGGSGGRGDVPAPPLDGGPLDGAVSDERPDPESQRMEAAVALIVRARERLDVLLIKRAEHEGDPWSGQMALPGGRWERQDTGLLHTAKRETLEETGVDLELVGAPLGRLPDVEPATPRLPPMRIVPYVFGVPPDTVAEVASAELASVYWVPLDLLSAPETAATTRIRFSGLSMTFPTFHVEGEHVWGLTHRILTGFLEKVSAP